jgi:hypothetical protein
MTPDEHRQYAATLLLEHARVEFMSVYEMAEEHLEDADEISDEDAKAVHDLIGEAVVTVTFPGCDLEWSNKEDES